MLQFSKYGDKTLKLTVKATAAQRGLVEAHARAQGLNLTEATWDLITEGARVLGVGQPAELAEGVDYERRR